MSTYFAILCFVGAVVLGYLGVQTVRVSKDEYWCTKMWLERDKTETKKISRPDYCENLGKEGIYMCVGAGILVLVGLGGFVKSNDPLGIRK